MKKINIFLMAAVAFGLASCEDKSDLGIAQVNPQLPSMTANGLTVSGVPASVNLDATVNQMIPVITVDQMENLPEGATVGFQMQLSGDENFSNPVMLDVTDGAVSSDDWEKYVLANFGKAPTNVTNHVRFAAYVLDNGTLSRLGGDDEWYLPTSVTVTPVDLKLDVEGSYYLASASGKVEMEHSDKHVYDEPNFSITFDVAADQVPFEWMIAPGSVAGNGSDADFFGVSETGAPDEMSGNLVLGGQKGIINEAGKYSLSANMLDKTYSISQIKAPQVEFLYTPGPANGWGFTDNMLLKNNNDNTFSGYVYIDGEFKLAAQPDWNPDNWGLEGSTLTPGSPNNIKVDPSGLYWVVANFNDMTIGLNQITRIGVIGDFNGWADDVALTPNDKFNIWTGEVDFVAAGGWKFRMNGGWDINLGGAMDNLTQGGSDMRMEETGVYTVTLDLSKIPYSCTVVKK